MDRTIDIFREGGELAARLVRQKIVPDFTSQEAVAQCASSAWFEIIQCPLTDADPQLFPQKDALLAAWDALGQGTSRTARALIPLILAETTLGRASSELSPLHALASEVAAARTKATAAHPRAYQGTKLKPPKERVQVPVDLRPALCGNRPLGFLRAAEEEHRTAEARLPELFRTTLYPLMRSRAGSEAGSIEIGAALAIYWALGLEQDPARLAAVSYLLSLQSSSNTIDWYQVITRLSQAQWTPFLHLLIMSGAYAVPARELPPAFADQMEGVLTGVDPLYRAYWLLHGLTTSVTTDYLVAGYDLADAFDQAFAFHTAEKSGYFPQATVLQWGEHCRSSDNFYAGMLLRLWQQCGLRPGLGEFVEQVNWEQFAPDAACRCLRLFATSWDNWDDLSETQAGAKWLAVWPMLGAIKTLLESVPAEYQEKCVWHLIEYLWQWDTATQLQDKLPAALTLTRRLCRPPFAPKSDPTEVTTDFLAELPPWLREQFLDAPDRCFLRLEEACRRENNTRLIGQGTYTLTQILPDYTTRCLHAYPALLFKAAKLLGCLPGPIRQSIADKYRMSPLFTENLADLPLIKAAVLLETNVDSRVFQPVPLKLREHLTGKRKLSATAIDRAAAQMAVQALRTGLEILQRETLSILEEGFAINGVNEAVKREAAKHALQMERLAEENRRPLRKFLRAYWNDNPHYIESHPKTRQWLTAHPRLNLVAWLEGILLQRDLPAAGVVSLRIEQDPLEALKLGTYVGSCLGLGGNFVYSAAAVVLDINKQVVYARDASGAVLARQLLAVDENDRLVCFSIYPLNVKPELAALLAEYDRLLSEALGLPPYDPHDEQDYTIAHILSHAWWDDHAWDLVLDQERFDKWFQ